MKDAVDIDALGRFIVARVSEDENEAMAVATSTAAEGRPEQAMEWRADEVAGYVLLRHSRALALTTVVLRVLWDECGEDWASVTPEQAALARLPAFPWRNHPDFESAWAYQFPRASGVAGGP